MFFYVHIYEIFSPRHMTIRVVPISYQTGNFFICKINFGKVADLLILSDFPADSFYVNVDNMGILQTNSYNPSHIVGI